MNDWLWDGTGEPDPRDAAIAGKLSRLAWTPPARHVPANGPMFRGFATLLALAAAALLVATGVLSERLAPDPRATWTWHSRACAHCELGVGEWLTTDANTTAELEVADIGKMLVDPNTRVRLVETGAVHRLELAQGTVRATVNAPPRLFVVDTPSANAVDLGCAYILTVDALGATHLDVTVGLVELEGSGRVARVLAGATVVSRPGEGPGTPRFRDAAPAYATALDAWDASHDRASLEGVLTAASTPRDALGLWHLQQFAEPDERVLVFERLAALVPPILPTDREAVLRGDRDAIELLWRDLWYSW